jgi:hypothetical protein
MHYRLHIFDSLDKIAATVPFDCGGDASAVALLRDISPICTMELWRDGRRVVRREGKPGLTARPAGDSGDRLVELERRIHEHERNLVLLRADHERLSSAGRPTEIAQRLLITVEETLRDMKEYRLLLFAADTGYAVG